MGSVMQNILIGVLISATFTILMLDMFTDMATTYNVPIGEVFNETLAKINESTSSLQSDVRDTISNESEITSGISIDESKFKAEVKQGYKIVSFGFVQIPKIMLTFLTEAGEIIGLPGEVVMLIFSVVLVVLIFYLLGLFFSRA